MTGVARQSLTTLTGQTKRDPGQEEEAEAVSPGLAGKKKKGSMELKKRSHFPDGHNSREMSSLQGQGSQSLD